jgi:hypothetical protein
VRCHSPALEVKNRSRAYCAAKGGHNRVNAVCGGWNSPYFTLVIIFITFTNWCYMPL